MRAHQIHGYISEAPDLVMLKQIFPEPPTNTCEILKLLLCSFLWSPILMASFDCYLKVRGESEAGHDVDFLLLAFARIFLALMHPECDFSRA